jgi:hypothetical protein
MKTRIMRILGAAGSAGALSLLCLIGTGGAAAAASTAPAQAAAVVSAKAPVGFQAISASFVSPTWGVVLGGHGHWAQLAVTADAGAHWSLMRAPAALSQVDRVVFANRTDGWLYNQNTSGLVWATHNGGATWHEIALPGTIQTMAATGRAVYAVVQRAGGGQLYSSPLGWNAWMRAGMWMRSGPMTGSTLAVSGNSVWFASNTRLWTTSDGMHWASYALRSPGKYYGAPYSLAGIAAANSRTVAFLWAAPTGMFHTGMKVMISFNGGRSQWQTLTAPPSAGDVAAFAAAPGRYGVFTIAVVTPGSDQIYRSANLGRSWTAYAVPRTGGGVSLNSLQFMSPTVGCLVTGASAAGSHGTLLWTANAGLTWYPVRI